MAWYGGGMEIHYTISEEEYVSAWKMVLKSLSDERIKASAVPRLSPDYLSLVLPVALALLLGFDLYSRWTNGAPPALHSLLPFLYGPAIASPYLGKFMRTIWVRARYRRDIRYHSEIVLNATRETYSIRYAAGLTSQSGWNVFKGWLETQRMILLLYPNDVFTIVNLAGLSEAQRGELRGIIAAVLPAL